MESEESRVERIIRLQGRAVENDFILLYKKHCVKVIEGLVSRKRGFRYFLCIPRESRSFRLQICGELWYTLNVDIKEGLEVQA